MGRISDEVIRLRMIIDGNDAQKELFELEKNVRSLNEENKALGLQKKLLEKQNKQETEEYKTLSKTIRDNTTAIKESKAKIAELQNQIGVTGLTMAQLQSKASQLRMVLRNLVPGSDDYKRYEKDLKAITDRMDELKGKGKDAGFSIGKLADGFNRFAALGASIIAMATGVVLSLQKMIDYNGKLSDAQTNVQKTTGMTKREVDELTKSFGLLKTRTARIDLLGIAEIGGRLGIAKEEIADFVKVMDKSAVALGDSFEGGPDVVAEKLGRIKGLYDELKNSGVEEVFESVGSALNDLGAQGTASEANMAEFVTRIGAMPPAFRPAIQEALGLGAAFEESGLKAEIAAGNYSKVISIAARDMDAFAKVLNRPRKELEELINTNPNEFFLQFASSLKGLDATDLAKVLDYLKLNDNEVKMVLGAASANVDLFREKIALAGQSMADATSLTTEYDLKNNNLAATLERLKKKVIGWFTSDSVVAFLEAAVNWFAKFIGAIEDSDGAMTGIRNTLVFLAKILALVVATMVSYTAGAKLAALWSNNLASATAYSNIVFKVQYAMLVAQEIATKALALAKALLTFNIGRVRVAYQALTVAMGMNPFGALLAIIGAVITAFIIFGNEADKTNEIMKAQGEILKSVADQTGKVKQKVADLVAIIKDENATNEQKAKALEQLKKIGKGYLDMLTTENILTAEGIRLIDRYIQSIDKLATAKAMVNVKAKLMDQKMESDNKVLALSLEKKGNQKEGWSGGGEDGKFLGLGGRNKIEIQSEMDEQKKASEMIQFQLNAIDGQRKSEIDKLRKSIQDRNAQLKLAKKDSQKYKELLQDIKTDENALNVLIGLESAETTPTSAVSSITIPDSDGDKAAAKKAKKAREDFLKAREKEKDDLKKYQEEVNDLQRQAIDNRLALMEDGFDKEEAIEAENHKRKIADLRKQLIAESEIDSLELEIDSDKYTPKQKAILSHTKETWLQKNEHINTLIELAEGSHQLKMLAIAERAESDRLDKLADKFELETTNRETAHNEELLALGNNEIAKAALQDKFDKEEYDRQVAQLRKLIKAKQDILDDKNTEIDFDLLTPEQKADIENQVAELKKKISELLLAKQSLESKSGTDDLGAAFGEAFGNADVLGFTADQWGQTFSSLDTLSEKLKAAQMVVGALQNIWGAYNDYLAASENASVRNYEKSLDQKKRKLKWQLDNGYINQMQYKRGVETMEADLEKKKAEAEYRQAKRQRLMSVVNIVLNTSQAIMGIWAQVPKFDAGITAGVLTAAVAALGALQLATVMKTPLPAKGYEEGLYPIQREQDGKIFNAGYGGKTKSGMVNKPTYFLAGENGPEMVIDAKAYRDMSPETKDVLWRELRRVKGFEQGLYNQASQRYEVPAAPSPAPVGGVSQDYLLSVIQRNSDILERAMDEGIVAYFNRDPRDLKKLMEEMEKVNNSKNKAKY